MKKIGRILAACLAAAVLFSLAACGTGSDSTLTSAQAGLYIETATDGTKSVVTLYGSAADSYSVDKNGNIVDSSNKIYVKAENAVEFSRITALKTDTEDTATFELWYNIIVPATNDRAATVEATETKFTMNVTIEPFDATCQVLTATIDDPNVIAFDEENNNIPSYGSIATDEYGRQTIVVQSNGTGTVQLGLVSSTVGSTNIRVATLDGTVSFWIQANVVLNAPGANGTTTNADGSVTTTNADGSTTTQNTDGSTTTTNTDGSSTTVNADGSSVTINADGSTTNVGVADTSNLVADSEVGFTAYTTPQIKYVLGSNGVNVRFGPGTSYGIADAIGSGEEVTALGAASNGWVKIQYGNLIGYMSANYLSDTAPVVTTTTTTTTTTTVDDSSTSSSTQGGATVVIG